MEEGALRGSRREHTRLAITVGLINRWRTDVQYCSALNPQLSQPCGRVPSVGVKVRGAVSLWGGGLSGAGVAGRPGYIHLPCWRVSFSLIDVQAERCALGDMALTALAWEKMESSILYPS